MDLETVKDNPYWNRPCAAPGLKSYRYSGRYGWIMIGATDVDDALREAARSIVETPTLFNLEEWHDGEYQPLARLENDVHAVPSRAEIGSWKLQT